MDWMLTIAKDSNNKQFIRKALDSGIRLFRINMAYYDDALNAVSLLNKYRDKGIVIFYDYPGPKMRIQLKGKEYLKFPKPGQEMNFSYFEDNRYPFITNLPPGVIRIDNHLSIADGKIRARVINIDNYGFSCKFTDASYELRDNAGCYLSGDGAYTPSFNYNDFQKIASLDLKYKPDWVILSFIDNPKIIQKLKHEPLLKNISIMAKIETPLGVDRLAEISEVSDGILIGRGDLRNTSEHRYNDYLTIALKKITKLSVYKGIGTFFLTDLSQNGTISEKDEKDLEYANGLDFIMLSKEVVNSNHPYAVLNYLAERCRQ